MTLREFVDALSKLGDEHGWEHEVLVGSDCCNGNPAYMYFYPGGARSSTHGNWYDMGYYSVGTRQ